MDGDFVKVFTFLRFLKKEAGIGRILLNTGKRDKLYLTLLVIDRQGETHMITEAIVE